VRRRFPAVSHPLFQVPLLRLRFSRENDLESLLGEDNGRFLDRRREKVLEELLLSLFRPLLVTGFKS